MSKWRSTDWYEVAPISPNEKWGHSGSSMTRQVDILDGSFQGRLQAAYDFIGYQIIVGDAASTITQNNKTPSTINAIGSIPGSSYIHRVVPMTYPAPAIGSIIPPINDPFVEGTDIPSMIGKYVVEAITKTQPIAAPVGVDKTTIPPLQAASNYQRARLTLECVTLPYAIIDDTTLKNLGGVNSQGNPDEGVALAKGWQYTRYITRHREPFVRFLTIPYGIMQTNAPTANNNNKLNKTGIPFREGGEHRVYTWMRVPLTSPENSALTGPNFSYIEGCIGCINTALFDGATTSTLLLDSVATREYQGAFGEWLMDITFHMIYLPHNSSGFRAKAAATDPTGKRQSPRDPNGNILSTGVAAGWNTTLDIDSSGNWDYYDVGTAGLFVPPYRQADFSALFRP